jgi:hypothetical protein
MTEGYDWAGFYRALCDRGPRLLEGIDDETREIVVLVAETDSFWSEDMESVLAEGAGRGEMQSGVLAALEVWRENVLTALSEEYAIDLDWAVVTIDAGSPLIDELVRAAASA